MKVWQAFFLGVVQGITEFLPVSSSGHLVLFQQVLGINEGALTFDVLVHAATLLAIIFYFRKRILSLTIQQLVVIGIASLPVAVVGLLFKDMLEGLFLNPKAVGLALLVTAGLNFYIDRNLQQVGTEPAEQPPSKKQAVIVGLFQAAAVIPGISRSGSTVAGSISQKFSRPDAFSFSFLIGVPAILGAAVLQVVDVVSSSPTDINTFVLMVGAIAAFFSGLVSLRLFEYIIKHARMEIFGWYCLVVGITSLLFL